VQRAELGIVPQNAVSRYQFTPSKFLRVPADHPADLCEMEIEEHLCNAISASARSRPAGPARIAKQFDHRAPETTTPRIGIGRYLTRADSRIAKRKLKRCPPRRGEGVAMHCARRAGTGQLGRKDFFGGKKGWPGWRCLVRGPGIFLRGKVGLVLGAWGRFLRFGMEALEV
jgi:hypothetical protein